MGASSEESGCSTSIEAAVCTHSLAQRIIAHSLVCRQQLRTGKVGKEGGQCRIVFTDVAHQLQLGLVLCIEGLESRLLQCLWSLYTALQLPLLRA